ncbi:hypothetical protein GCK72_017054 [Caenorhabditis remanei]|uniref:Uncharacterized protein n=1 Tax=Caenorhabditis remanei TaxID=31234 RepID=A0A6A5G7G1_CAERE|nr:hypothetical protein GCK72_017054 [Caenorhabditis remanei]KAF1750504.1 hypothetical protein GCK72_017054 [Caenorhabditis remanei]
MNVVASSTPSDFQQTILVVSSSPSGPNHPYSNFAVAIDLHLLVSHPEPPSPPIPRPFCSSSSQLDSYRSSPATVSLLLCPASSHSNHFDLKSPYLLSESFSSNLSDPCRNPVIVVLLHISNSSVLIHSSTIRLPCVPHTSITASPVPLDALPLSIPTIASHLNPIRRCRCCPSSAEPSFTINVFT